MKRAALLGAFVLLSCGGSQTTSSTPPAPSASGSASVSPPSNPMPAEGAPAPPIVATASNGEKIDLAKLAGKHVVVYFYPKDDTPGCTKEACAFRDAWTKLQAGSIIVIGISRDDDASHKAFAEKHKLPFALVADTDGSIGKAYGVSEIKPGFYARVSFLIGPDGKVKKVYPKVDPALHADQILEDSAAK